MPSPQSSRPVVANFPSENLITAAGVAIFHLASSRVVLCYHTRDRYWFLPKGRRNASEEMGRAAEREGYEESGYRNRLLPIPLPHRQPDADTGHQPYVCEPVWTQLVPLNDRTQYLLFWYVAETIPPEIERLYEDGGYNGTSPDGLRKAYRNPPPFPMTTMLRQRIAEDHTPDEAGKEVIYEPVRHLGTGVDEEEAFYTAQLVPIEQAYQKLKGSTWEDVIRRGWAGIQKRLHNEAETSLPP